MPGWRVGYALFPKFMFDKSIIIQSYSFVCAPTPLQYASLHAFDVDMSEIVASYKKKRDIVYNGLREFYPVLPPPGSFYIFPEVPKKLQATFIEKVLAKRLLVVPGTAFSQRTDVTHFRVSFAAPDESLHKGVKLLQEIAKEAKV